jgi:hypothetical protein
MLSSRSIRSGVRASERRRERKEKARQELALFEFACMATAFTSTAADVCATGCIAGVWIKRAFPFDTIVPPFTGTSSI